MTTTDMQAFIIRAGLTGLAKHVRACPEYSKLVGDMEIVDKAIELLASRPDAQADERGAFDIALDALQHYQDHYDTGLPAEYAQSERIQMECACEAVREALQEGRATAPQAEAAQSDDRIDALQDMAFAHGLQLGWNFGLNGARADYEQALKARDGYVKVLRETRAAPSPDREQVAEAPEGCTPADAEMLRAANHSLAAENDYLRRRLRPFAQLASSPLSWAMVEYAIDGDPEKQVLQAPQMQRAFNRAAEALNENAEHQPLTTMDVADTRLIADLLEALEMIVSVADRKTIEFDKAHAVIARAKTARNADESSSRECGERQLSDEQLAALGQEWFSQITKGVGTAKAVEAMRALLSKGV